jgi:hypothetical protein
MEDNKLIEELMEIGKALIDIDEAETKAVKENFGCSFKKKCSNYKRTPPKGYKKYNPPMTLCDRSYKQIGKVPLTLLERYFSCTVSQDYKKFVIGEVEKRTNGKITDLEYKVSSLLSFIVGPCQFQQKCPKYEREKNECENTIPSFERLFECDEPYGKFISRVISNSIRKRNLKSKKDALYMELTGTVSVIMPDGRKDLVVDYTPFGPNESFTVVVNGENELYKFISKEAIKKIEEQVKSLANELLRDVEKRDELQIKTTYRNLISDFIGNLERQYLCNELPGCGANQHEYFPGIFLGNNHNILTKGIQNT